MADEDEAVIVVEQEVKVAVVPPKPKTTPEASNATPPWVSVSIVSILVGILGMVLVVLPCSFPATLSAAGSNCQGIARLNCGVLRIPRRLSRLETMYVDESQVAGLLLSHFC